jgi:glycosyltransferase involved in cell wall biosynthesis
MQLNNTDKSIVHILSSFRLSGAHIFAVNLANEQVKKYNVTLISLNPRFNDIILTNRVDKKVKIVNLGISRVVRSAVYRLGNCFSGMRQNNPLFSNLLALKLIKHLKGVDIVHTHLVRDRYIIIRAMKMLRKHSPKHIMTDHGGFIGIESSNHYHPQYSEKIYKEIFDNCSCIVTLSDTQNAFWQQKIDKGYKISFRKIYNGSPLLKNLNCKSRKEIGYAEDDFIFAMVARGDIPSKGWELTINAFLKIDDPKSKLMLIGGGIEIDRLKKIHGKNSKIIFLGFVQNPSEFLQLADVGVLASNYAAESLPLSVIEYLQAGKPVIGSDIGEIKNMLQIGGNEAGILLPIKNNFIDLDVYVNAMKKMQYDKDIYECFKKNAINASKQFGIADCADKYAEVYCF